MEMAARDRRPAGGEPARHGDPDGRRSLRRLAGRSGIHDLATDRGGAMTALWAAILASSLAGSLHCVAMCGPLLGLHGGARSLRLALVHALGRLTTYAALGAL